MTIWVELSPPEAARRGVIRDGEQNETWWQTYWIPSDEAYAARESPAGHCDIVVDVLRSGSEYPSQLVLTRCAPPRA